MYKQLLASIIAICFCLGCADAPVRHPAQVDTSLWMKIHIVSAQKQLPDRVWEKYPNVVACAYPSWDIWIIGEFFEGEILLDPETLGHEVLHLLNWSDARFPDPDE